MGLVSLLSPAVTNGPFGNLITALFKPSRAIGPFATQVTIEEIGHDELQITDHPVEIGAMITDHAFKRPAEVVIKCGFSNSSLASLVTQVAGIISLATSGSVGPLNYAKLVYQQMLSLQATRAPFTVVTGKRTYKNMLMKSISVQTDEKTENILMVSVHCREVILVGTQTTQIGQNSNGTTPTPLHPAITNPIQTTGTQTLAPATPSPGGAAPPQIGATGSFGGGASGSW